jgi:replicative DNA helicase
MEFIKKGVPMSMLVVLEKWIRMYDAMGWKAIPVRLEKKKEYYKDDKKHPDFGLKSDGKYRRWGDYVLQMEHSIDALRNFKGARFGAPANSLAIVCGKVSGLLVLDLDDEKTGLAFLEKIGIKIYFDTYRIESQSGKGAHYYFKYDDRLDDIKTTRSKFFGESVPIDIRGNGGLIFCPPSVVMDYDLDKETHYKLPTPPAGKKFKIYSPPENLIKYLLTRKKDRETNKVVNEGACKDTLESMTDKQRAVFESNIKKLSDAPIGARSEKCFSILCLFIRFRLCQNDAYELIKNVSKFKERDKKYFEDMWESALHNEGTDKEFYKVSPEAKALSIINRPTASNLLNASYSLEPPSIIGRPLFYRRSLSMLAGDPGIGKTTLSLDLIKAAVDGTSCWDGSIDFSEGLRILVFHGDLGAAIFSHKYLTPFGLSYDYSERLKFQVLSDLQMLMNAPMLDNIDTPTPVIHLDIMDKKNSPLFADYMRTFKPDMVVIDTFSSFCSADQNDIVQMKEAMTTLKTMASKFNFHMLILHHARKRSTTDTRAAPKDMTMDDIRGSSAIPAFCDFILGVSNIYDQENNKIEGAGKVHCLKEGALGAEFRNNFDGFKYKISNERKTGAIQIAYTYDIPREISKSEDKIKSDPLKSILSLIADKDLVRNEVLDLICLEYEVKDRMAKIRFKRMIDDGYIECEKFKHNQKVTITDKGYQFALPKLSHVLNVQTVEDIPIKHAMEDDMKLMAEGKSGMTRLTDEQKIEWYNDRTHWDAPKDWPVIMPPWTEIASKYPDSRTVPYAIDCAKTLWHRRDKLGNMLYTQFVTCMKELPDYDFDLAMNLVYSFVEYEQLWYHALYNEKGVLQDVVLRPQVELFRKYIEL